MAVLARFDADGTWGETWVCDGLITQQLAAHGLGFGRWPVREPDSAEAPIDTVIERWRDDIDALRGRFDIRRIDRVRLTPDHADWPALRRQFIAEHTHAEAEIRSFLGGTGLFYIRADDAFWGLLCEAGEWVALPAGTRHFFDAGDAPDFDALRLLADPRGWVAQPTGDPTPDLPLLDEFVAQALALTGDALD